MPAGPRRDSPRRDSPVTEHLEAALEASDVDDTNYHVRHALQLYLTESERNA